MTKPGSSYEIKDFNWYRNDRRMVYKQTMIERYLPDEFWVHGKEAAVRFARYRTHNANMFVSYTAVDSRWIDFNQVEDIRVIIRFKKDYLG